MKMYITHEGESLYDVAKRYNVQVEVLQAVNKHIKDPTFIKGDTQITIPSVMGMEGIVMPPAHQNHKGNVCAYVPDEMVTYNQPKFTHWPSQDYTHPYHTAKSGNTQQHAFYQSSSPYPLYDYEEDYTLNENNKAHWLENQNFYQKD